MKFLIVAFVALVSAQPQQCPPGTEPEWVQKCVPTDIIIDEPEPDVGVPDEGPIIDDDLPKERGLVICKLNADCQEVLRSGFRCQHVPGFEHKVCVEMHEP